MAGFDIGISDSAGYMFPGEEYAVLGRSERGTSEKLATEFLGPCLGIIGYDAKEDEIHGAHLSSPTGSKVEGFLNSYDVNSVFVTGLNYGPDQLESHQESKWRSETISEDVLNMDYQEAYRIVADGGVEDIEQLTAVEDIFVKRGDIESTLQQNNMDFRTEWASGASMYSAVKASTQDEEIQVLHSNL